MTPSAATLAANWLLFASQAGLVLLLIGLVFALVRAARGPEPADRLVALKQAWLTGIGLMALVTLMGRNWRILDIALALALLGGVVPLASAWAARRKGAAGRTWEERHVRDH